MKRINVIIAEDHEPSRKLLVRFLEVLPEFHILDTVANGEELVQQVMVLKPELVLADIQMPRLDGVNAVKECVRLKPDLKFIFLTAYDEYAVEAFRLFAVDYIMKPVEKSRFYLALERAKRMLECGEKTHRKKLDVLSIQFKHSYYYIPLEDILFIERIDRKCVIHTREQRYQTYETMEKLIRNLDESFFQTHRSYIVHVPHIHRIDTQGKAFMVHFKNYEHTALIAKQKINSLFQRLDEFTTEPG